ncbi:MAG: flagellar basal body-associated FliL family protein [Thermodesulfobacteriota bacterium]
MAVFLGVVLGCLAAGTRVSAEEAGQPLYKPLPLIVVNLSGGRGNHYLRCELTLECDQPEVVTEIDRRLPQIKDTLLMLLSGLSYEEALSPEGKRRIRAKVLEDINALLTSGRVSNTYFLDYVAQ